MEPIAIAAFSALTATILSHPLELIKIRFQLQGELKKKGEYPVHYKGFFHALYIIAKTDGLLALQRGLLTSLCHQFFLNGIRLSGFHIAQERKWTLKPNGEVSLPKSTFIAGFLGAVTAYTGSPFYLVKIRLMSKSSEKIAVGTQHKDKGMVDSLISIYKTEGVCGLWRGCGGSIPRRIIGSAAQLVTFTWCKDYMAKQKKHSHHKITLVSSLLSGLIVSIITNPLDVISTRLYNQGVDTFGRGLLYADYFDVVYKLYVSEGLLGFYKGFVPMFIRTGPHSILVLYIWDTLRTRSQSFKTLNLTFTQ